MAVVTVTELEMPIGGRFDKDMSDDSDTRAHTDQARDDRADRRGRDRLADPDLGEPADYVSDLRGAPAARVGCIRRDLVVVALGVLLTGVISACGSSVPPSSTSGEASAGPLGWTVDDLDLPGELRDVAVAGDRVVAVGFSHWEEPAISAVLVSDDRAQTWHPAATDGLDAGSMVAVTHGPTGFVAVGRPGGRGPGQDAAIWSSGDGLGWQPVVPPTRAVSADLQAVAASDDRYVAGGMDGPMPVVWISTDGLVWQEAPPFYGPGDYPSDADISGDAVTALATRDGTFVAALGLGAHRGEIWSSVDGLTWTPIGKIDASWISRFARDERGLLAIGTGVDCSGIEWAHLVVRRRGQLDHGRRARPGRWSGSGGRGGRLRRDQHRAARRTGHLDVGRRWHLGPGRGRDGGGEGAIAGNVIAIDDAYVGVGSRGQTTDDTTMVVWHGAAAP